jgi:hypothetical protein
MHHKKVKSFKKSPILDNFHLRIVYNANPIGRDMVLKGEYCRRTNPNGVDLNRNWDYEFGKKIEVLSEENPGKQAFSEIETRFVKKLIDDFKPEVFLSIHSGIFGLFHPYAFHEKEPGVNKEFMINALKIIKDKYCTNCLLGSAAKLIGYFSSGTSMDYIYDIVKVPKAFVWEIYTNENALKKKNFFKFKSTLTLKEKLERRSRYDSKFRQGILTDAENIECFAEFNPNDGNTFKNVRDNWTNALFSFLEFIKNN